MRHVKCRITIYRYKIVIKEYKKMYDREPTEKELCKHLNLTSKALEKLKRVIHTFDSIDSLENEITDSDGLTLGNTISDGKDIENDTIDKMMNDKIRTELWQLVKENTTPEENTVIRSRYIKSMSLEATGQSIGQTRDRVRTIEARALRKLRTSRIRRELKERFEINYARAYRGSFTDFKYTGTSIVENIALKNLSYINRT